MLTIGILALTIHLAAQDIHTANGQPDGPISKMVSTGLSGWHYSRNWIQPYHQAFGNQAPKDWLSRLSLNMQLFENHQSGSLILIIKDEYETLEEATESPEYDLSDLGLDDFSQLNTSWPEYDNTRQSDFAGKIGQHRTRARLLLSEYEGEVYTMLYLTKEPFLPEQAGGKTLPDLLFQQAGRHGDDRRLGKAVKVTFFFPDLCCCLQAIHFGHLNVHEDEAVVALFVKLNGFFPISGYSDRNLRNIIVQVIGGQHEVKLIIIDQQHLDAGHFLPHLLEFIRRDLLLFPDLFFDFFIGKMNGKSTAQSDAAIDRNAPPQQVDELAADA